MRWLGRVVLGLCGAIVLYVLAALLGAVVATGASPASRTALEAGPDVTVHLISGPIHYDFLLPVTPDARQHFASLRAAGVPIAAPNAEWLVVGWGSEAFYTTVGSLRDVSAQAVWRAVTGDAAVLRVDVFGAVDWGPQAKAFEMSARDYARLLTALSDSLQLDPAGAPRLVAVPAPGRPGWFFAAEPRFHLFRTCNVWIGTMLRAAGQRFGIWTPTPFAVRISHALYLR